MEMIDMMSDGTSTQAMVASSADHRYCVARAKRARSNGNDNEYLQWMKISSLRKGDPINFYGFTASFVGVLYGFRLCLVYEVGGNVHRLGLDDLA
jgi:hypothetical protein